jgi:hypothetical protein
MVFAVREAEAVTHGLPKVSGIVLVSPGPADEGVDRIEGDAGDIGKPFNYVASALSNSTAKLTQGMDPEEAAIISGLNRIGISGRRLAGSHGDRFLSDGAVLRRGFITLCTNGGRRWMLPDLVALNELADRDLTAIVVAPDLGIDGVSSGLRSGEDLEAVATGVLEVADIVGRGPFGLDVGVSERLKLIGGEGLIDVNAKGLGDGRHLGVYDVVWVVAAVGGAGG